MMIKLRQASSNDKDFIKLVASLDKELAVRDGDDHAFYNQFNKIHDIKYVLVAYNDEKAVGCGAIKELSSDTMEVKRMYVLPEARGKGYAKQILVKLEKWAIELGYAKCALETGKKQPEAIALYKKCGYTSISNYGQYAGIENSLCFQKLLVVTT